MGLPDSGDVIHHGEQIRGWLQYIGQSDCSARQPDRSSQQGLSNGQACPSAMAMSFLSGMPRHTTRRRCRNPRSDAWSAGCAPCSKHRTRWTVYSSVGKHIQCFARLNGARRQDGHRDRTKTSGRDRLLVKLASAAHAKPDFVYAGTHNRIFNAHLFQGNNQPREVHGDEPRFSAVSPRYVIGKNAKPFIESQHQAEDPSPNSGEIRRASVKPTNIFISASMRS